MLPQLFNLYSLIYKPDESIWTVSNLSSNYIRNGKKPQIIHKIAISDITVEGLQLINIEIKGKSARLNWIKRTITRNAYPKENFQQVQSNTTFLEYID